MCLSALIFLPSCLLRNLSWLSYFSAVGVFSSCCLVFGLIATGLMDSVPPNTQVCVAPSCTGSLYKPSQTDVAHVENLLPALGLIMVGFSGHAVFPTLRNDMVDKGAYPRMVNTTYAITCSAYLTMACCGYLMFGSSAQPEVTVNMSPENVVARLIIWVVIVNPVTKFALDLAPIAHGLEGYLILTRGLSERSDRPSLLELCVNTRLVTRTVFAAAERRWQTPLTRPWRGQDHQTAARTRCNWLGCRRSSWERDTRIPAKCSGRTIYTEIA